MGSPHSTFYCISILGLHPRVPCTLWKYGKIGNRSQTPSHNSSDIIYGTQSFMKYSRTLLRSLSRDQRIRDSSGKTYYEGSLLKAIGFWDFKKSDFLQGKTSYAGTSYPGSTVYLFKNSIMYLYSTATSC
jgi:hypothetical protein